MTSALSAFIAGPWKTSSGLVSIVRRLEIKPTGTIRSPTLIGGMRSGALMIAVGGFECFVNDLFREKLAPLSDPSRHASMKPVWTGINRNYVRLLGRFLQQVSLRFRGDDAALSRINLSVAQLGARGGYYTEVYGLERPNPSAQNITSAFGNIGLGNILNRAETRAGFEVVFGSPIANDYIPSKLDEIVILRHRVAHSGSLSSVSGLDLQNYLEFFAALAVTLDEVLSRWLDEITV